MKNEIVISDFELATEIVAGKLTSNAKEFQELVEKELSNYTIDRYIGNPDFAKKDKAVLNNAKKGIATKRKEVMAQWNKPLDEFLNIMKGLEKTVDEASSKLDSVVKEAENKEKSEKKAEIESFYNSLDVQIVSLDKFFNEKWLNKTYKMKDIKIEIETFVDKVATELETLKKLNLEETEKDNIIAFYLDSLDINQAVNKADELRRMKEAAKIIVEPKVDEETNKLEEVKQEQPKEEVVEQNNTVYDFNLVLEPHTIWAVAKYAKETNITVKTTIKLSGSLKDLQKVRQYMATHNISYVKE